MQEVNLELQQSKVLLAIIGFVYCLTIPAVLILQVHWLVKFLLFSVLIASSVYSIRQLLLLDADAIVGLQSRHHERVWLTTFRNGSQLRLQHMNARVFRSVVILQLSNPVNQRRYRCLVAADAISSVEHSQLRALVLALDPQVITEGDDRPV